MYEECNANHTIAFFSIHISSVAMYIS